VSKTVEQWLLFKYVGGELTPLSKPFRTKKQAEKAREKYPERFAQDNRARCDSNAGVTPESLSYSKEFLITFSARFSTSKLGRRYAADTRRAENFPNSSEINGAGGGNRTDRSS
jgi:hypothetical protein